ncbi:MAG: hypothetical protein R2747_08085 [Pyrinomonadaceae bacterium]
MIAVPYPHMVLNAHNNPGVDFKMWNSWKVPESTSVSSMVSWIAKVARGAPGGCLSTLIFNSHGQPGQINIGYCISLSKVGLFNILRDENLVERIWIVACNVARIDKAGTKSDGNYFCYRLAQESGAFVRAGNGRQWGFPDLPFIDEVPYGYIDDWNGTVYSWNPRGELIGVDKND